jgi:sialidase-1
MTHNLGEDAEPKIVGGTSKGSRTVWHSISTDDGLTWSKPIEKTASVKKPDWNWYATGPGVGIQTRTGRLIIPCDNKSGPGGKLRQSHVIYSDDRGKTWKLGGVIGPKCNESQIVELADGSLLINMRSYDANKVRFTALSKDGGATFTSPIEDQALIEPVCQASIIRIPGEGNGVLFCNPASRKRENLTVRLSDDGGTTWKHARTVYAGPAAYSCLAALPDGTFACLFECGEKDAYQSIKLARFTRWWVEGR